MNRELMFPTKSRLQVATALEMLAHAERRMWVLQEITCKHFRSEQHSLLLDLFILCHTRLLGLVRPCLFPGLASYYHHLVRPGQVNLQPELLAIRAWRKRYPNLLVIPPQEK